MPKKKSPKMRKMMHSENEMGGMMKRMPMPKSQMPMMKQPKKKRRGK